MRIFLPQQLMTDVDALHGDFLAIDENSQRLFALTSLNGSPQNAVLTVVQLASVCVPFAPGWRFNTDYFFSRRHIADEARQRVFTQG
jgi:hypothetical protein